MKLILQHFQWEIFIILFSDTSHFDVVIYFLLLDIMCLCMGTIYGCFYFSAYATSLYTVASIMII